MKIDSLVYSAYRWRTKPPDHVEPELFIAYYISSNKYGGFKVMRHNTTPDPATYFKGNISDSLIDLINSTLSEQLDSTYFDPRPRIYDGNHYSLGFTDSVKHNIQFIQNDSPPFLRELSIKLDSVIFKSTTQIDSFNLEKYKNYLKEKSIAVFGEIPTPKRSKPPKINTIKFEQNPLR